MPNRLAAETSPYLLQHADNPVDWYPWGEEAFARARAEDRPILLSVGYSSCHWCHVMAHESFENPAIAEVMNRHFINIKVDREERPDVDAVYMAAVQAISGQGGWPMTVFLTPEGEPFYAGTYFPPEDMHGRPGFRRVLEFLAEKWQTDRARILESARGLTEHLRAAAARRAGPGAALAPETTRDAVRQFAEVFDTTWGGFGSAPKFPSPSNLEFLLAFAAAHAGEGEEAEAALSMALHTLRAMATGGIYDQLGGGFARYSVDERWVVPHFEKMLYDNAQLARAYLHAFQLTGDGGFERIVRETLEFLLREMRDPAGGFYAALDADSEGIEGKYYLWTVAEIEAVLGEDAPLALAWYGVTEQGNFFDPHHPELTGRSVLTARPDLEDLERRFGGDLDAILERVESIQQRLFEARQARVRPGLDDKVLTSWNGLALAAFAEAARVLDEPAYRQAAIELATFLRENLWRQGVLYHTWKAGQARVPGMLEDYTYTGLGLVELYRLTGDLAWLEWARELWLAVLERFRDREAGGFFDTAADAEQLIVRQKSFFDAATPSGNGSAALLGLWLGRYFGPAEWEGVVEDVVAGVADYLLRAVTGFGGILQAMEFALAPHREVVIVGPPAARVPFERVLASRFLPFSVVAPTADAEGLPLFEGREPEGDAALAYVCENMACRVPASTPGELEAQLAGA
ncbi:thioredoxin domain-containing protein [Tepidiforma sp.]|uniref:thioredoxin domain-containing protein n=1 Tax=Tepidiforma sp. TaxID=2682230 RepID=UPI002ADE62ED|nr:thioredoxin domain-containing protein [Tepidiforma sp.]